MKTLGSAFTKAMALILGACLWQAETYAGSYVLSFDDAPMPDGYYTGPELTKKTIEALKVAGVDEAVFYCNPGRLPWELTKPRLQSYSDAGHVIAHHTWDHPALSKTEQKDYIANLMKAQMALKEFPTFQNWFRYPYLDEGVGEVGKHDAVKKYLEMTSTKLGYVTVETYDWYLDKKLKMAISAGSKVDFRKLGLLYRQVIEESVEFYDELAKQVLGRSPVHVLLLHEKDLNALYLTELVAGLRKKGFEPVRATEAWNDPIADASWDGKPGSSRRLGVIAKEKGFTGPTNSKWLSSHELDEALKKYEVFSR